MLTLADAGRDDVFYDLGCGWGQNLMIALTEFGVKRAVGIEMDLERFDMANKRLSRFRKKTGTPDKFFLYEGNFAELFDEDFHDKDVSLGEATVVFYGLDPTKDILEGLRRSLKPGTRLITYYGCLFPEVMPIRRDYPFFLSVKPFHPPRTAKEWLSFVVNKPTSSINPGSPASEEELWDELAHDYDVDSDRSSIDDYRERMTAILADR